MKIVFLFFCIFLSQLSKAGHLVGNGGVGYQLNSKIYLLDFVESGLEETAFVKEFQTSSFKKEIETLFDPDKYPIKLIANKLQEIAEKDPEVSKVLLNTMRSYNWNQSSLSLKYTGDESALTNLDAKKLVQLAVRKSDTIYIDSMLWRLLDEKNKLGLIFHEVVYAALDSNYYTNSFRTREIISFLFNPNFLYKNGSELDDFLGHDILNSRFNIARTIRYGGEGIGKEVQSFCPFGFVLNGVRITAGERGITSIASICRNVRNNSTWTDANMGTDAGPIPYSAQCANDEIMTGAIVAADIKKIKKLGRKSFVASDISLYCKNVRTGVIRTLGAMTKDKYLVSQSLVCPEKMPAAVGVFATLPDVIADLGFICYKSE